MAAGKRTRARREQQQGAFYLLSEFSMAFALLRKLQTRKGAAWAQFNHLMSEDREAQKRAPAYIQEWLRADAMFQQCRRLMELCRAYAEDTDPDRDVIAKLELDAMGLIEREQ